MSKPKTNRFRLLLLYSFPAVLFCSYYPLIPLAHSASTNYELSLPLIWLFIFAILSLKDTISYIYNIFTKFKVQKSLKSALPLLPFLLPLYLSLTTLWSANPLRAVLAAGIFWCLLISAIGVINLAQHKAVNSAKFLKIFLLSSCIFSALCWLQSLLDVLGVDRNLTLLCQGCTSYSFGFPHPSGLAIEPQFMGNLLLAPTLTVLYLWLNPNSPVPTLTKKSLCLISFFLTSTLFLTFSRGAIYSFVLALVALIFIELFKCKNRLFLKSIPLVLASFLFVLGCQGFASQYSAYPRGFACGVTSAISQLSLGTVELDCRNSTQAAHDTGAAQTQPPLLTETTAPVFDGYVEESTNTRMTFNRLALELSVKNPTTFLFGYGLGSAGETMFKEGKTATPFEIIQNEYLSLLLETGIIGLLFATTAFVVVLQKTKNCSARLLLGAVILSFAFSLLFFSGLPNALHVYLFPVFLFIIFLPLPSHLSRKQLSSRP